MESARNNCRNQHRTLEGALGTTLFIQWLCEEISRDMLMKKFFPPFRASFRIETLVREG